MTAMPYCTGTREPERDRRSLEPGADRGQVPVPRHELARGRGPEAGRSALDAVELTNHAAELLREHTPDFTRIHHVVTAGGNAPMSCPTSPRSCTIFATRNQVLQELYARLVKCAEAGALATETRLETRYLGGILEILPNQALGRVARTNLEKLNDLQYDDRRSEFAARIHKTLAGPRALPPLGVAVSPIGRGRW